MFFSSQKLFDQNGFLLDIIFYASISNKPAREKINYFYKKEAKKSIYFLKKYLLKENYFLFFNN
jgi:hypothetical protein